jgi:putative ABC transport system permease protein
LIASVASPFGEEFADSLKINIMIKNYIKIAWRNLVKQRLYSFISISGLAVGLAVCIMITLYVAHEISYDRFHKNVDRIFTAHYISTQGGGLSLDWTKYNSGEDIKKNQPGVDDYTGVVNHHKTLIVSKPSSPNEKFVEDKLLFAGENFFKFFSFKLLAGNANTVLKHPYSVVISKDMAQKYFGHDNPVGKTIVLRTDSAYTYQVTGVAENSPSNSSINFNFVASGSSMLSLKGYRSLKYPGLICV